MSTMSNLDELERLLEAATPLPWYDHTIRGDWEDEPATILDSEAALIVAAVNSLPALIAAARRAEALDIDALQRCPSLMALLNRYGKFNGAWWDRLADEYAATLTREGAPR